MADEDAFPPDGHDAKRRQVLNRLILGIGAVVATALASPVVAFVLSPLLKRRSAEWLPVGPIDRFNRGEIVKVTYLDPLRLPWAGYAAENAAWLSCDQQGRLTALSAYCTHTGCPVRWEQGAELFLCPCHGGVFRRDGSVAAGPPPRPLPRHPLRVRQGQVEILPASPLDGVVPRQKTSGHG